VIFLASRFVGPFLPIVQKWEKTLSLISEVMDEWLSVQQKWLYLEGIFVGGDIRQQLPNEARKFDDMDKEFHKVRNLKTSIMCQKEGSIYKVMEKVHCILLNV
jgi:hypothetical protein